MPRQDGSPGRASARPAGLTPRNAVFVIGGLVALVLILTQVFGGDGGGGGGEDGAEPDPTPASSDADEDPLDLFGSSDDRPPVDPIRGCDLLTDGVLQAALGSEERSIADMGISKRGEGETCTARLGADTTFFVSLEPGDPADFGAGAILGGHEGADVTGVGDTAVWFGGAGTESDPARLAVHEITSVGDLVFRVSVGRPDLSPDELLEAASAAADALLLEFPFVESGAPEPVEVVFEADEPPAVVADLARLVAEGEERGEWTRGEGLVEGLRLLLGEPSELRAPDEPDPFGGSAGLLLMARAYAQNGDDESARVEIENLLARFTSPEWAPGSPESAPDQPGGEESASGELVHVLASAAPEAASVAQDRENCLYEDRSVYGEDEPTCKPRCLWRDRTYGADEPICLEEIHGIELFYPEAILLEGSSDGWDLGDLDAIREALVAAGTEYVRYGVVDNIEVQVSTHSEGPGMVLPRIDGDRCVIYLTTPLQPMEPDLQAFSVATEVAGCVTIGHVPETVFDDYEAFLWWYSGVSTFLAGEALPASDVEWDLIDTFRRAELSTSLQSRKGASNWPFFRSVAGERGGPTAVFDIVGDLRDAPSLQAQQDKLAAQPGIAELLQIFHQQLSNGFIPDVTRRTYDPLSRTVPLRSRSTRMSQPIIRFGAARYHVTVPSGRHACFEDLSGAVKVSWRPGAPGASDLWAEGLPEELTGEAVIVVTTIHADQSFRAAVRTFDEPGCRDDDEAGTAGIPELCGLCEPSFFYRNPGTVDGDEGEEDPEDPDTIDDGTDDEGEGNGAGSAPPPPASEDIEAWLAALCRAYDDWDARIAITDGVDPTQLALDERIERADQLNETLVAAADDLLGELDTITAPEVYREYQDGIVDQVIIVQATVQRYLDTPLETESDLINVGTERQIGLDLIASDAAGNLRRLPPDALERFDAATSENPECASLPR